MRRNYDLPRNQRLAREVLYKCYCSWREFDPEHLTWVDLSIAKAYRTKEQMPDSLGRFWPLKGHEGYQHLIEVREGLGYDLETFITWHEVTHYVLMVNDLSSNLGYAISDEYSRMVEAWCDGFATACTFWHLAQKEVLTRATFNAFFSFGSEEKTLAGVQRVQAQRILTLAQDIEGPTGERIRQLGKDLLNPLL